MNRVIAATGMFAVTVMLTLAGGCRARHEIYLNPDGTGRMVVEITSDRPESADDAESQLTGTPGVAAWTAVSLKTEGDKTTFKGTALFTDLNKSRTGIFVNRNADGNLVIEIHRPEGRPTSKPDSITDEQIKAQIARLRTEYEQAKSRDEFKQAANSRWDIRIHVAGQVVSAKQFKQAPDGTLELSFEGQKVLDATDKMMADDKMLAAMLREGESPNNPGLMFDGLMLKGLFGSSDPIRAEVKPADKPLFDFKAEVAGAGADWLNKALLDTGIIPAKLPEPDPAAGEVTVEDIRMMPAPTLPHEKQSIRMELKIKPADKACRLTKVELFRVLDGDGKLVVPAAGAERTSGIYSQPPEEGFDRQGVNLPPITTGAFKEISGVVRGYLVKSTREVDLGTVELKAGAKGTAMGFELTRCEKQRSGSLDLSCKFDKKYPLARLVIKDESGKELKGQDQNASKPRDTFYLYAYGPDKWPDKVKFVAVLAEGVQTVDVPFRFKDVKLPESK